MGILKPFSLRTSFLVFFCKDRASDTTEVQEKKEKLENRTDYIAGSSDSSRFSCKLPRKQSLYFEM